MIKELENKKEKQIIWVVMFLRMANFMIRRKHKLQMMLTLTGARLGKSEYILL